MSTSQAAQAQNPNELFDIVDENDCVIGQATRAEVHQKKLLHRAVHILLTDAQGNFVLQKRSMAKDTCPGLLSTSCAGHVDAGETYETAAVRELGEELGVPSASARAIKFLFKMSPSAGTGWEFVHVYKLEKFTGTLTPAPAEISAIFAFPPEEIDAQIARAPADFSESFRIVWERFRTLNF